jgi:hypothetical protein
MEKDIDEYQISQAVITGRAQAAGQAAASGGQGAPGGGPTPGTGQPGQPGASPAPPIQMNKPPTPPGQAAAASAAGGQSVELGQLTSLLDVVRGKLHGQVWAVGEIAVAGRSAVPRVMVERKEDQGVVNSALQSKGVRITVGTPSKDEPKVTL